MKLLSYHNKKGTYQYMRRVKKIVHYPLQEKKNWQGQGVTVVVMDTGIAFHPEFQNREIIFRDFINGRKEMYDDNGHGTHVCGILGGSNIGIAPRCTMIVLKVLDMMGNGDMVYSMKGFRWILENQEKYNIRIVNISMGMKPGANLLGENRILNGVDTLWDMGIIVVAAAGNLGPLEGSITIPGRSKKIITVGSSDILKSGRGAKDLEMYKPDLVAPGANILSCCTNWRNGQLYIRKSGTSMSAPIVSGAAALLLSTEPNLTNEDVKYRLKTGCDNLGMSIFRQGKGCLNVKNLMQ